MAGETIARREVLGKLGEGARRVAGDSRGTHADGLVAGVRLAFILPFPQFLPVRSGCDPAELCWRNCYGSLCQS